MEEPRVYKLYLQPGLKLVVVLVFVALIGIGVAIAIPAFLHESKAPPPLAGVIFVIVILINLIWILRLPHQIILSPDGMVEFVSLLRRRVVRANDIRSIRPHGTQLGFFMVQTEQGKIRIVAQFDGFHDFLTRLKALHPGVELRGC